MQSQRLIADRYSLVESLPGPSAGMGWRARDLWSDQLVMIIQVPAPGLVGPALLRARHEIAEEVRAFGDVPHDRLVRPVDVVLDADELWVASELLPAATLAHECARRGAVPPAELARWGRDVADGLAAAHDARVTHRNLHAGVVGLTGEGRSVVGGFATTVVTPDGLREGIPVHVAPEVARGAAPSPAADVFALGAVLYTAVEGRDPFPAAAGRDQLLAAVTAGVVAPPQRAGQLSELLIRMLHPDPAQRPTATAVAVQLGELIAASGVGAGVPAAPAPATVGRSPYRAPLPWAAPPPGPGTPESSEPGLPPTGADPAAARRARMWWLGAAAVVAVLALAGGLLVAFRPSWTSALPGLPAAAPAPAPSVIGDPRTADPCSLLTTGSVQRFGTATMYPDFGYPQSCLIEIATGGNAVVELAATFGVARDEPPAGAAERSGKLVIYREVGGAGNCMRTVLLGDGSRVYVRAEAHNGATTDLCAVAESGTQTTVLALSGGSLPRREITGPPNALIGLDTCSVLDQAALAQVPGLDASRRVPGFAGWLCIWGDTPAFVDESTVKVAVDRSGPLPGRPAQIGGRLARVVPGGPDNPGICQVELVQRSYPGTSGNPRVELLEFTVYLGAQPPSDAACRSATALAQAAASKLPAPA